MFQWCVSIFENIYLQKNEEYFAGDSVTCNNESELYKELVSFIIKVLKIYFPCMIKSSSETKLNADLIRRTC